jgi:hypothetical protein
MSKTKKMVEYDVEQLLAARYCAPEWAFLPQVSNGTGMSHRRTADAVAMNCYPSRGMEIHGFEIKVSRADWLREVRDPDKSIAVQQYCDRWWIVVSDLKKIIEPGELPPTWGVMAPWRGGLKVHVKAPELKSKDLSRTFVASLLRKAAETMTSKAKLDAAYMRGKREGMEHADKQAEHRMEHFKNERDALQGAIREFEEKAGVRISQWNAGRVGDAVHAILHNVSPLAALRAQRDQVERLLKTMNTSIEALECQK